VRRAKTRSTFKPVSPSLVLLLLVRHLLLLPLEVALLVSVSGIPRTTLATLPALLHLLAMELVDAMFLPAAAQRTHAAFIFLITAANCFPLSQVQGLKTSSGSVMFFSDISSTEMCCVEYPLP